MASMLDLTLSVKFNLGKQSRTAAGYPLAVNLVAGIYPWNLEVYPELYEVVLIRQLERLLVKLPIPATGIDSPKTAGEPRVSSHESRSFPLFCDKKYDNEVLLTKSVPHARVCSEPIRVAVNSVNVQLVQG
jgi:hypothetical protein